MIMSYVNGGHCDLKKIIVMYRRAVSLLEDYRQIYDDIYLSLFEIVYYIHFSILYFKMDVVHSEPHTV